MVQPNMTAPPVPVNPAPPAGFLEYLSALVQSGAFPALVAQAPVPPATSSPIPGDPPPPTEGHSFTRVGRGRGGALAEKEKVSKQITASATKRKTLVDPDVEAQPSPTPDPVSKRATTKSTKRRKTAAVRVPLDVLCQPLTKSQPGIPVSMSRSRHFRSRLKPLVNFHLLLSRFQVRYVPVTIPSDAQLTR
jgi:hypothetical protein